MSTVIIRGFDVEMFSVAIHKYKVTILAMVPPVILLLAKHPVFEKFDFSVSLLLLLTLPAETETRNRTSGSSRQEVHHLVQILLARQPPAFASWALRQLSCKVRGGPLAGIP